MLENSENIQFLVKIKCTETKVFQFTIEKSIRTFDYIQMDN